MRSATRFPVTCELFGTIVINCLDFWQGSSLPVRYQSDPVSRQEWRLSVMRDRPAEIRCLPLISDLSDTTRRLRLPFWFYPDKPQYTSQLRIPHDVIWTEFIAVKTACMRSLCSSTIVKTTLYVHEWRRTSNWLSIRCNCRRSPSRRQ